MGRLGTEGNVHSEITESWAKNTLWIKVCTCPFWFPNFSRRFRCKSPCSVVLNISTFFIFIFYLQYFIKISRSYYPSNNNSGPQGRTAHPNSLRKYMQFAGYSRQQWLQVDVPISVRLRKFQRKDRAIFASAFDSTSSCSLCCLGVRFRFGALQVERRRSGQSVTASDFGSNGPRFESGRARCVESLDKALYSHCPKEKPSH